MNFHVNMDFKDIAIHYGLLMVVCIVGGVIQSIPIMALAIPIFLMAILGYSPIYAMLGIDHNPDRKGDDQVHNY